MLGTGAWFAVPADAIDPLVIEAPTVVAGDRWEFAGTRDGKPSTLSITVLEREADGRIRLEVDRTGKQSVEHRDGTMSYLFGGRLDRPQRMARYPLKVGERWTFERRTDKSDRSYAGDGRVVARRMLTRSRRNLRLPRGRGIGKLLDGSRVQQRLPVDALVLPGGQVVRAGEVPRDDDQCPTTRKRLASSRARCAWSSSRRGSREQRPPERIPPMIRTGGRDRSAMRGPASLTARPVSRPPDHDDRAVPARRRGGHHRAARGRGDGPLPQADGGGREQGRRRRRRGHAVRRANAKPDGYTVLLALSSISIIPEADKVLGRDPMYQLNQLVPIARFTADPTVLAVRADAPWKSAATWSRPRRSAGQDPLRLLGQLRHDARADGDARARAA